MKRFLSMLLAGGLALVCGILGVALAVGSAPADTSIDEGWRLAWIGLGSGLLVGLVAVWGLWRLKRDRRPTVR